MNIGVIGCGVVGSAVEKKFRESGMSTYVYDKYKKIGTLDEVVKKSELIFVCVPTPTVDLMQDVSALKEVLFNLYALECSIPIVIKCTVLPGTCRRMSELYPGLRLVHNPEFLTERNAARDFENQKVAILGSTDVEDARFVAVYFRAAMPNVKTQVYDKFETTELGKYIHNCFLATKVAFMNEMYNYAELVGADYAQAADVAVSQGVIGASHMNVPGPDGQFGFGGMCFPKDTEALIHQAPESIGEILSVLNAAVTSNKKQRSKSVS